MTGPAAGVGQSRPLTYDAAESAYHGDLTGARKRYEQLTERELCARTAAKLRERGEFDPGNPGHRLVAEAEPLGAAERLELMATGEVLARYYRHPSMLDHAVKAGASWEQIGAARGTTAGQARQNYWEWAEGQHRLWQQDGGRWGLDDAAYAEALAQAGAPDPGAPGDAMACAAAHPVLCAHADEGGQGAHWLAPGEKCPRVAAGAAGRSPAISGSADDVTEPVSQQLAVSSEAERFTADITRRALWARDYNDGRPEPAWSTGERLAVALVLADQATLDAEGYTRQEATRRLGGDLAYCGYPGDVGTWLQEVRAAVAGPPNAESGRDPQ